MSVTTSGLQSKSGNRVMRSVVEVFSSMRFAIALLVILSIASIIGTVLTQDDPYPELRQPVRPVLGGHLPLR